MMSVTNLKDAIKPIIYDYQQKIENSKSFTEVEDKSKTMIQQIVKIIKPDYRVELIQSAVMP